MLPDDPFPNKKRKKNVYIPFDYSADVFDSTSERPVSGKNKLLSSSASEHEQGDATEYYKLSAGILVLSRFSGFQESLKVVKVTGYSPAITVMSALDNRSVLMIRDEDGEEVVEKDEE